METHWPDHSAVTADRPAWETTRLAAEAFGRVTDGERIALGEMHHWHRIDLVARRR